MDEYSSGVENLDVDDVSEATDAAREDADVVKFGTALNENGELEAEPAENIGSSAMKCKAASKIAEGVCAEEFDRMKSCFIVLKRVKFDTKTNKWILPTYENAAVAEANDELNETSSHEKKQPSVTEESVDVEQSFDLVSKGNDEPAVEPTETNGSSMPMRKSLPEIEEDVFAEDFEPIRSRSAKVVLERLKLDENSNQWIPEANAVDDHNGAKSQEEKQVDATGENLDVEQSSDTMSKGNGGPAVAPTETKASLTSKRKSVPEIEEGAFAVDYDCIENCSVKVVLKRFKFDQNANQWIPEEEAVDDLGEAVLQGEKQLDDTVAAAVII